MTQLQTRRFIKQRLPAIFCAALLSCTLTFAQTVPDTVVDPVLRAKDIEACRQEPSTIKIFDHVAGLLKAGVPQERREDLLKRLEKVVELCADAVANRREADANRRESAESQARADANRRESDANRQQLVS